MNEVLDRARYLLGESLTTEQALIRALDELAHERSRGRRWDWNEVCEARAQVLGGTCSMQEAADRLGMSLRTLRQRWRTLGMVDAPSTLIGAIRQVIDDDLGATDEQIAERLKVQGISATRVSVFRARQEYAIPSSYVRRIDAERDEVAIYLRDFDWMDAQDICRAMRADEWPWPIYYRRILRHVRMMRAAQAAQAAQAAV